MLGIIETVKNNYEINKNLPMKKYTIITTIQILSFSIFSIASAQIFSGGDGTPQNPYQVSDVYQLQSIYQYLDKNFVLIDNIDATDTQYWDSNLGFRSFKGTFSGTFDGAGFTIQNLYQNRPDGEFGIFDSLGTSSIVKNLVIQNFDLDGTGGTIAKVNYGTISNVQVHASLTGGNIGGIVRDNHSIIKNSGFTGTIQGGSIGGLVNVNKIAALIEDSNFDGTLGDNGSTMGGISVINDGTINRTVVEGVIINNQRMNAEARIGGIAYENNGIISFSEMSATLYGFRKIGGIAYTNSEDAIISDILVNSNIGIRNYRYTDGSWPSGGFQNKCWSNSDDYYPGNTSSTACRANNIGGLVGLNQGVILNVLITSGIVDASSSYQNRGLPGINNRDNDTFGKVFGIMESASDPVNTYYNAEKSVGFAEVGTGSSDGIVGWPESGLIGEVVLINLEGFDFETIWRTSDGYPELRIDEFQLPLSPVLNVPQNNAENTSLIPNLDWQEVNNATAYQVQVSTSPTFETKIIDIGGLTSTSYKVNIPLTLNTTYYWRVRSENSVGESLWSSVWNFTTVVTQPPISQIALYSPENESNEQQRTVNLLWQQDLQADGYQLQVAEGSWSLQNLIVNDPLVENNSYILDQLSYDESYYWRVRNIVDESYGEWSDVWSFQTHNTILHLDFLVFDQANNSKMLTIGTATNATEDFDLGLDILAPPAPPDGSFDARVSSQNFGFFTEFKPETVDSTIWTIKFKPESNNSPIVIEWDPNSIGSVGIFRLEDRINGEFVNVDLSSQNSISINESFITELDIKYYLTTQVSQSYKNNWDLVSLPVTAEHDTYDEFYSNSMEGTLYSYNGFYQLNDDMTVGTGYWLNFNSEEFVTYEGFAVDNLSLSLDQYWNLIGSNSSSSVIIDPENIIIPGTLYGYNGTYVNSNTIEPGKGYWVASLTEGEVNLQPNGQGTTSGEPEKIFTSITANTRQKLDFIQVTNGAEHVLRSIYLLDEIDTKIHPMSLTLPPLPPSDGFDVRLKDNRWATVGEVATIRVQHNYTNSPLYVRFGNQSTATRLTFYDRQSNKVGEKDMSNQMIFIPEGTVEILVETEILSLEEFPTEFELLQNYPNPFNPQTQISYSLAQNERVKIEVFAMTGQRVALLLDEEKNAGLHSIAFDASKLATGAYIYRITAGSFTDSKMMTFIK